MYIEVISKNIEAIITNNSSGLIVMSESIVKLPRSENLYVRAMQIAKSFAGVV